MPYYNFIAKDPNGRNYRGSLFGVTEQAVFFRLQQIGYVVLSVTEKNSPNDAIEILAPKITIEDIALFSRLLATVVDAGLPVVEALAALEEQTENTSFRKVIRKIRYDVEEGTSLSSALHKYPKVFPHFFVSMVLSGEAGGNLPEVLEYLSRYMEKDQQLTRGIRSAFAYPKFVLVLISGLLVVLFRYVFPVLQKFYDDAPGNIRLPRATSLLMSGCSFVSEHSIAIVVSLVVFSLSFLIFKKHDFTKHIYDKMIFSLPLMGPINRRLSLSRTIRTLGSLLHCGVPLISALETTKNLTNNKQVELDLEEVIKSVETGGTISSPLRMSTSFSPLSIYMISVGEHSGRLPELMGSCADAIDKEIDHLVKQLLLILEPALIVLIAIIVAFLAIAIYLPVFSTFTSFS